MTIKELREKARKLRDQKILPPYYLEIEKGDLDSLELLSGYIPVRDFRDSLKRDAEGFYTVGACEYFIFVMPNKRHRLRDRRGHFHEHSRA